MISHEFRRFAELDDYQQPASLNLSNLQSQLILTNWGGSLFYRLAELTQLNW
jgi:hypothetical protein